MLITKIEYNMKMRPLLRKELLVPTRVLEEIKNYAHTQPYLKFFRFKTIKKIIVGNGMEAFHLILK